MAEHQNEIRNNFIQGNDTLSAQYFDGHSVGYMGSGELPDPVDSFVRNCWLIPHRNATYMFAGFEGHVVARLENYAIIPIDEYKRLKQLAGEEMQEPFRGMTK